jgi:hypothetical protein
MPPVVEVAIRGGRPLIARNSAPVLLADLIDRPAHRGHSDGPPCHSRAPSRRSGCHFCADSETFIRARLHTPKEQIDQQHLFAIVSATRSTAPIVGENSIGIRMAWRSLRRGDGI